MNEWMEWGVGEGREGGMNEGAVGKRANEWMEWGVGKSGKEGINE